MPAAIRRFAGPTSIGQHEDQGRRPLHRIESIAGMDLHADDGTDLQYHDRQRGGRPDQHDRWAIVRDRGSRLKRLSPHAISSEQFGPLTNPHRGGLWKTGR